MNDNGFNFHSQGFRSFDDIFKDFDFGSGNGHGKEWKFSFGGGGGGFDDFFDEDDEEEDDDFFGGFKFGGFGDSFFGDGSFPTTSHREDVFTNDDGERMHRNVRHTAFRESSKCTSNVGLFISTLLWNRNMLRFWAQLFERRLALT